MKEDYPMFIWQAIQVISSSVWAVLKAILSLLPIFDQVNGLQDQIVAAALGIPVFVISIVGTLFAIGKFIRRRVND